MKGAGPWSVSCKPRLRSGTVKHATIYTCMIKITEYIYCSSGIKLGRGARGSHAIKAYSIEGREALGPYMIPYPTAAPTFKLYRHRVPMHIHIIQSAKT